MLLALVLPAFSLTVPVRASLKEEIVPGETAVASSTTTATVALSNPVSGVKFAVADEELTVNKREASGKESLSFAQSPAGSVRTWAIYYLDVDGNELGNPEVVDVSFDDLGNGTVAARGASSRLTSLVVKASKSTAGQDSVTKVAVQDSGADAAYIGLLELTNSDAGSDLLTNPDLTVMDAAIFAAFQGLTLDAVIPLDTYTMQLDGSLNVSGLAVSAAGTVESGAELQWDLAFFDNQGCIPGSKVACTPVANETLSYLEPIGTVKKKSAATPRVVLKNADILIDSSDASFSLTIQGDVRELEVSAAMDVYDGDELTTGRDVVTLDPGGFGAQAKSGDDTGGPIVDIFVDQDTAVLDDDNVGITPPWTAVAANVFEVIVEEEGGGLAAEPLYCQLNPSAATRAGTARKAVLVGECTHGDDGVEVRRLRAVIDSDKVVHFSIDVGGPAFAPRTTTTCEKGGACTTTTTSLLDGTVHLETQAGVTLRSHALTVTETDFDLPFQFDQDIDGMDASVSLELYTPVPSTWSVVDGVVTAKSGDEVVASFDVEDVGLEATGDCRLPGFEVTTASVPAEASVGPVVLKHKTGPGKFTCQCRR